MTSVVELTLSHLRSHQRTKLDVDPRPVAIYGPNGAGKTNILEAVSLLSPGRGLRRAGAEDLIRRPESLGWKVSAIVNAGGTLHEIETEAEPTQSRGADRWKSCTADCTWSGHSACLADPVDGSPLD